METFSEKNRFFIRKAEIKDIETIMQLYENGRQYMRSSGNMQQWTNGFPPQSLIEQDICDGISQLVIDSGDNSIAGVFAFLEGPDPTYMKIYDGCWPDNEPYSVIHRICSAASGRGVASFAFNWCLQYCRHLRIDTHRDNIPMQKALEKNGFKYCGIIYIADGSERLAFQKKISNNS